MHQLIALAVPGGPRFVDGLQRAWAAGDAVLPVDLRLPRAAQQHLITSMGAAVVVDEHGDRAALHGDRVAPVEPGDALVVATSGTTGEPKGVVHTHDSVRASARITSAALDVGAGDHWIACLPLAHIGGLSVVTRALHTGTRLSVLPSFDAAAVRALAEDPASTLVSLVTAALRRVDPTRFRTILLGGATPPLDRPTNAVATYGMTETGSGVVYDHRTLDGVELRTDERGQLLVRSPTLLRCYRDGTDPRTADGWFPTGDAAMIRADGTLHVFGRIGDLINTGGEKVWPTVVEQALRSHPAVDEALVFGEPDSEWGQRVVASIETSTAPPSLDELRDHVKASLPAYAAPKAVYVVDRLERTGSGKVRRSQQSNP